MAAPFFVKTAISISSIRIIQVNAHSGIVQSEITLNDLFEP